MRKKQAKPLFDVKHDFVESLDAFIQAVIVLSQAVKTGLDLDLIKEPAAGIIREKMAALEAAMLSTGGE